MAHGIRPEEMNEVYRELAELVGTTAAVKIWKYFAGQTVTFPQRIYSREYTRDYIESHMETEKAGEMARKLFLSERRVRQLMQQIRKQREEGRNDCDE